MAEMAESIEEVRIGGCPGSRDVGTGPAMVALSEGESREEPTGGFVDVAGWRRIRASFGEHADKLGCGSKLVVSKSDGESAIRYWGGLKGWCAMGVKRCFRVGERIWGELLETRFGSFGTRRVKGSDVVEATCRASYEFDRGWARFAFGERQRISEPENAHSLLRTGCLISVDQSTSNWAQ